MSLESTTVSTRLFQPSSTQKRAGGMGLQMAGDRRQRQTQTACSCNWLSETVPNGNGSMEGCFHTAPRRQLPHLPSRGHTRDVRAIGGTLPWIGDGQIQRCELLAEQGRGRCGQKHKEQSDTKHAALENLCIRVNSTECAPTGGRDQPGHSCRSPSCIDELKNAGVGKR